MCVHHEREVEIAIIIVINLNHSLSNTDGVVVTLVVASVVAVVIGPGDDVIGDSVVVLVGSGVDIGDTVNVVSMD